MATEDAEIGNGGPDGKRSGWALTAEGGADWSSLGIRRQRWECHWTTRMAREDPMGNIRAGTWCVFVERRGVAREMDREQCWCQKERQRDSLYRAKESNQTAERPLHETSRAGSGVGTVTAGRKWNPTKITAIVVLVVYRRRKKQGNRPDRVVAGLGTVGSARQDRIAEGSFMDGDGSAGGFAPGEEGEGGGKDVGKCWKCQMTWTEKKTIKRHREGWR